MSKEKMVCVEWDDAAYNSGYWDKNCPEDFQVVRNQTVGHLIQSNKKVIIVATDKWLSLGNQYRHISTIPRGMVRKITYLRGE